MIPLFFVQAHAEVTITLPDSAEPLLLNGKDITSHQLISQNGPQQLVFNARASYREFGQQKRFVSETLIVTFSGDNNHYRVAIPKINSPKSAEKFNDAPQISLTDTQGKNVAYKMDKLLKDGIQIGRDYSEEIKAYNMGQGVAAIAINQAVQVAPTSTSNSASSSASSGAASPAAASTALAAQHTTAPQGAQPAGQATSQPSTQPVTQTGTPRRDQINVGQMLDFWYEQADEATREAFKKRIGLIEQAQRDGH
ncbi:DUF2057 domain-containing protein [Shewanella alkalitolerans]|uniref:DUF2057 domain-containing protein n=1 Tax=Shewanella alkalitolerans TaxID=2864209 RepID=UPI001C65E266|nr:DUF2057 domain-containing protein [Shewanella alkalitolerans]QYJ96282.1 DUF2057 domain-containing protein [Shewanella alkalitolerans]